MGSVYESGTDANVFTRRDTGCRDFRQPLRFCRGIGNKGEHNFDWRVMYSLKISGLIVFVSSYLDYEFADLLCFSETSESLWGFTERVRFVDNRHYLAIFV